MHTKLKEVQKKKDIDSDKIAEKHSTEAEERKRNWEEYLIRSLFPESKRNMNSAVGKEKCTQNGQKRNIRGKP